MLVTSSTQLSVKSTPHDLRVTSLSLWHAARQAAHIARHAARCVSRSIASKCDCALPSACPSSRTPCRRPARLQSSVAARAAPAIATDSLVTVDAVSKTHDGMRTLFTDLSFTLARGERMAIIGANGSGKTSLLRLISGADWPDDGDIHVRKNVQVGYLAQDADLDAGLTAFEAVVQADSPIAVAVRRYHELLVQGAAASKPVWSALASRLYQLG